MRPLSPSAGAVLAGALSTTALVAAPAAAQLAAPADAARPAPSPGAAPTTTTSTGKARAVLGVTSRRLNVRAGGRARVSGRLRTPGSRSGGRVVTLERRAGEGWSTIDKARTTSTGRYVLSYRTRGADTFVVRARFAGDRTALPSRRGLGRLNAFRSASASWYGPGLYGGALGCGGRLGPGTVGVAHKTLPCGTRVVLRKGDRIVRTRVIDRGPYVGGREFDLTAATKRRLGFGSTGLVQVAH